MKRIAVGSSSSFHHQRTISEEVITDILFHLPVKTLGRFKCVSKKWNDFISYNPYFRKHYKEVGGYPLMLGLFPKTIPIQFTPTCTEGEMLKKNEITALPFDESLHFVSDGLEETLHLLASSNGFLLLGSESRIAPSRYYICNPITKEWSSLPTPRQKRGMLAFFCKENINHYKVIRAIWNIYSTNLTIQILDSEMVDHPQWKEFSLTCSSPFFLALDILGIISEKSMLVYWPVHTEKLHPFGPFCNAVIVFDPNRAGENSLQLDMILVPGAEREEDQMSGKISQMNGLIVCAQAYAGNINLWALDEDTKEWSLRYSVENPNQPFLLIEAFHPLDSQLLIWVNGGKLVWYNLQSKTTEIFFNLEERSRSYIFRPYVWPSWPPSFLLFK